MVPNDDVKITSWNLEKPIVPKLENSNSFVDCAHRKPVGQVSKGQIFSHNQVNVLRNGTKTRNWLWMLINLLASKPKKSDKKWIMTHKFNGKVGMEIEKKNQ